MTHGRWKCVVVGTTAEKKGVEPSQIVATLEVSFSELPGHDTLNLKICSKARDVTSTAFKAGCLL